MEHGNWIAFLEITLSFPLLCVKQSPASNYVHLKTPARTVDLPLLQKQTELHIEKFITIHSMAFSYLRI